MMRLWQRTHAKTPAVRSSAVVSVATHAALVTAAVIATAQPAAFPKEEVQPRAVFLNPADRLGGSQGHGEQLHFISLTGSTPASRPGTDTPMERKVVNIGPPVDKAEDSVTTLVAKPAPGPDSVLSVLDVDVAVTRYLNSAAPAFPPDLLEKNVEGMVSVRYVVDTTGYALPSTLTILTATHPQFALAVQEALPFMRFHPARVGERKVKQEVEQDFTFKIEKPRADSGRGRGRGPG